MIHRVVVYRGDIDMRMEEFNESLQGSEVPDGLSVYLAALWYEKRGDWNKAHEIVQDIDDSRAARIHAYLHRREGDDGNAAYWYRRADKPFPSSSLDDEWNGLIEEFLPVSGS
jgi:hypothetical protein